jgi:hypothetical protein
MAAALFSIGPELSVRETYDDNVDRVRDNRRDDFITSVGVGLTLRARSPRLTGAAGYGLGAEFFAKETEDQGQLTHTGSLSLGYQATRRLALSLGDNIRFSETAESDARLALPAPPPEPGPGPAPAEVPPAVRPGSIPTRRVRRLANTAVAGFTYLYDERTTVGGSYGFEVTRFDAPDLVDTDTHRGSVTATRQVARNDRVGVTYALSWSRFDDRDRGDRQFHDARLTWGHDFSQDISSSLSVGATWTDRGNVGLGLVGDTTLTKRVGLTRYSLTYSGAFRTSEQTGEALRSDRAALGVARDFSRTLAGRAGAAYTRSEPLEDSAGVTHTYSATAGFGATLASWLRTDVDYSFERNDAPAGESSFRNNRVTVGLTVLFPPLEGSRF